MTCVFESWGTLLDFNGWRWTFQRCAPGPNSNSQLIHADNDMLQFTNVNTVHGAYLFFISNISSFVFFCIKWKCSPDPVCTFRWNMHYNLYSEGKGWTYNLNIIPNTYLFLKKWKIFYYSFNMWFRWWFFLSH